MNKKKQVLEPDTGLFQKRFIAFIIDWLMIAFLINAVITFPKTIISGQVTTDTYFPAFSNHEGYLFGGIALLVVYLYMVILPMIYEETLGKKWMHIKVVQKDNTPITFITRNIRFFSTLIIEARLYNSSLVFYLLISMITGITLGITFEYISWGITILSGIYMLLKKEGMFHDVIAKTKVVAVDK